MIYSEPNNLRLKTFRSRLRYCSQVLGSIIGKKGIKTLVFLYMCIFILNPRKVHINHESLRSISKSFVYYTETHRRLYSTPYSCEYLRGLSPNPNKVRRSVGRLGKTISSLRYPATPEFMEPVLRPRTSLSFHTSK